MSLPRGALADQGAERVVQEAAVAFDVTVDDLTGPSRCRPLMSYRQIAMAAARMVGHSFPKIGSAFGGRDHTTVVHACQRVAANPEWEAKAKLLVEELTTEHRSLF